MNLVICSNYSWPHMGGSERVIQHIAEAMASRGMTVTVLSRNVTTPQEHNGIQYDNCQRGPKQFLDKLKELSTDHLLVYSDYFIHWPIVLAKANDLNFKTTLIPVGMNAGVNNLAFIHMLIKRKDKIQVVTHSDDYQDFKVCKDMGIEPKAVIPNGVDLNEFDSCDIDFRKKYNIQTKYMLLCVSNFFPGKGQEFLPRILRKVHEDIKEFTMVFINASVDFTFSRILKLAVQRILDTEQYKHICLEDIPREDVVAAFKAADLFLLPSQKEVAPLVILESMAASTPWVSLPVGNVNGLAGGSVVCDTSIDNDGKCIYSDQTYKSFSGMVVALLSSEDVMKGLAFAGRKKIEEEFNWNHIGEMYYSLFTNE